MYKRENFFRLHVESESDSSETPPTVEPQPIDIVSDTFSEKSSQECIS